MIKSKILRNVLLISIAILVFCGGSLIWIATRNNESYNGRKTQEVLRILEESPRDTYSREFVQQVVQIKFDRDEALARKDRAFNDSLRSICTLLLASMALQIFAIIHSGKMKLDRVDIPRAASRR